MIARHWQGVARAEHAASYLDHLLNNLKPEMAQLTGFVQLDVYRRDVESGLEMVVISTWDSLESIQAFAGPHIETAVIPDKVRPWLITFESVARHYQVATHAST